MTAETAETKAAGGRMGAGWVEIVATVLLALAAVATAWSSYQANRWNGEQAKTAARVNALRIEAARAQGLAQAQTQVDIAMFFQWVNATETGDRDLADFYRSRFRPEFGPAFEAWQATDPLTNPEAEQTAALVLTYIQTSANYVLAIVLFAVSLFFAGMSAKLRGAGTRKALLLVGCLVFIGTAIWIATFPVVLSV